MAKWADFVITKVRYNTAGTHIDEVLVADDLGESLGQTRIEQRKTVVANLNARKTYITGPPGTDGKATKGALVETIDVNGAVYLRTDRNKTARDNLGSLPTF